MREYWKSHFLSTITGLAEVKQPLKSASYLAGYLGGGDKFQKARFSQNWVFPYFWDFGKFYKKENGLYVPDEELVRMSLIHFQERRKTNIWFNVFVDVRKYGWEGVFKMNNEKWGAILGRGDKGKKAVNSRDLAGGDSSQQLGLWEQ